MASEEGYALKWTDEAKAQLRGFTGLSRRERIRLFYSMHRRLSRISDAFRDDPANRVAPGSSELIWTLAFSGDDGEPLRFAFVVDVRAAPHGVLEIITVQRVDL